MGSVWGRREGEGRTVCGRGRDEGREGESRLEHGDGAVVDVRHLVRCCYSKRKRTLFYSQRSAYITTTARTQKREEATVVESE